MKHKNTGWITSIANQKGGVGKTTSCINLAASLAAQGKRILLIDLDPQGNTTTGLGIDKQAVESGTYEVLMGEKSLQNALVETDCEHLFLLSASMDLAGLEIELVEKKDREHCLRQAFLEYDGRFFDHVLIDCPPALSILTLNALTASDAVMIPLQTEFYAMEGLSQLMDTIRRVRSSLNPDLLMDGILLTMVDRRNNLAQQVEDEVRGYFGELVYKQVIPRNVRLSEAPSYGTPVMYHDARSLGAEAYLQFSKEFLLRYQAQGEVE
ncbi:MAG: AAA family ATPase [Mariprofundaceae bacterium]|nr:AAA family ATPase [Mariprofundaceae bacterium]